jgi:hypothetical protein
MSQPTATQWEAGAVLNIFTPTNDIACAGVTQLGNPCGWRLEGSDKADARELLEDMSDKSPIEALDDLPELARLVLCRKNHQNQADRVISRWKKAVKNHISATDRAARPSPSVHGTPGRRVASGGSNSPEAYDDIIADISRLSISPAQLRTIVEEHVSDRRQKYVRDGSAGVTPSNSTPSLVRSEKSVEPNSSKVRKFKFFKS